MAEKEYIEREAAICTIERRIQQLMKDPEFRRKRGDIDLYGARRMIAGIPAADVRPVVRGKWESHGEGIRWVYVCSACGYVDGYPMNDRMNFCPNCGATMEES